MTISFAVAIAIAVAALLLAARWYHRFALADLQRLESYERHADAFFAAAKPLVSDDETPEKVLRLLRAMSADVVDKRAAARFLAHTSTKVDAPKPLAEEMDAFFERRPELGDAFLRAVVEGFLAMTFASFKGQEIRQRWRSETDNPRLDRLGPVVTGMVTAAA